MKSTRLEKYRQKNRPLIFVFKIVLIGYLVIFSVSYLTAETVAYFASPQHVSEITITAGTWENETQEELVADEEKDESSLVFTGNSNENIKVCPAVIEVKIKNNGEGPMHTESFYEIYYVENGDPVKDGDKIALDDEEGIIEMLENGETATLIYETSEQGTYTFVAYQHEDYVGDDSTLSENVIVDCESNENEQSSEQEEEAIEESSTEGTVDEQESHSEENEFEENNKDKEDPTNVDESADVEDVERHEEEKDNEMD